MQHRILSYVALCLVFICLPYSSPAEAATKAILRAGAAVVDITPREFPLNMVGGHDRNMADGVHDALHARALVLDDGSMRLAMVVVDNLGSPPDVLNEAKQLASQETGIAVDRMLVCSTCRLTHSGCRTLLK